MAMTNPGRAVTHAVTVGGENMSRRLHHLLSRYPGMSAEKALTVYADQFRQYNEALVARRLAMPKDDVMAQDMVDARAAGRPTKERSEIPELSVPDEMSAFMNDPNAGFYRVLPCFSKGVFRVNDGRFFWFEMLSVDVEARTFRVALRDYREMMYAHGGLLWEPGIYGIADIALVAGTGEYEVRATDADSHLFHEIYRQVQPSELGWDKFQKDAWKYLALANAKASEARLKENGTNNVIQLARLFLRYTSFSNFVLESNRAELAPGQEAAVERNREITKTKSNKSGDGAKKSIPASDIPEKLVRNVGILRVKSVRPPRPVSSKSIRNYKIPSWTARGHVRRYKSGKTVYVKPSVHHRRSLSNPDGKIPQTVINIINDEKTAKGGEHDG